VAYTAQQGAAQVNAASITPADLPAGWVVQADVANPRTDPDAVACGILSGRTVSNLPEDPLAAFLAGQTLGFFTNAIAYATEMGAMDCAQRAAARFQQPGALARAFGDLFVDPNAVVVAPYNYPPVGDASIAGTLTGKISVSGTTIDLTLLVVAFRIGNVGVVVGSARSGSVPPADELAPLINLVLGRVAAQQ
jgi:hypothetical protein